MQNKSAPNTHTHTHLPHNISDTQTETKITGFILLFLFSYFYFFQTSFSMKTKLFFMALGALALASCSMDDPVVETQSVDANSINFRTMIGSRGSATTTANLEHVLRFLLERRWLSLLP